MSFIILTFFLLSFQSNIEKTNSPEDCEVCGEYRGGRDFFSWTKLILNPNDKYEYSESRHTMQSREDNGKWIFQNDVLILNSANKTKWKGRNKWNKKEKMKFFFKKQKCEVKEDFIIIKKNRNKGFNSAYYSVSKIEK
ncbi:MAG: hypothetical protein ACI9XO_004011 [Paraglaciecola sp.]|jgi:hypothetical protein